jgi:hypothetical protein
MSKKPKLHKVFCCQCCSKEMPKPKMLPVGFYAICEECKLKKVYP